MAVVIRYQSFAANAVLTHRFQSVARPPLRCDGSRAGIKRCSPLRFFSALFLHVIGGPLTAPFSRWQRVVRYSRCTFNSFGALAQACKQSSRRFTKSFHRPLSVVAHDEQFDRGAMQCPTKALKELTR